MTAKLVSASFTKRAWIRDASAPVGSPARGKINCPCGNAPWTFYGSDQPDVRCNCGVLYSAIGWILEPAKKAA